MGKRSWGTFYARGQNLPEQISIRVNGVVVSDLVLRNSGMSGISGI